MWIERQRNKAEKKTLTVGPTFSVLTARTNEGNAQEEEETGLVDNEPGGMELRSGAIVGASKE